MVKTVTTVAPATPHPRPRPARVAPTYTTYSGSDFSVDYPDTWNVDAAEVSKGSYYDTTIRSLSNPDLMVRVDVTPYAGTTIDVSSAARGVEQGLVGQSGYRELAFTPSTFNGYDSVDWRFVVREGGVPLQKEDTFFVDDQGDGVAILTQAPVGQFARWRSAFAHIRQSLAVSADSSSSSSSTDFCATHACIDSFYEGTGYIVQCNDGMWSHSGGLRGRAPTTEARAGTRIQVPRPIAAEATTAIQDPAQAMTSAPGNGYTVVCADGSISHSGGIQGACSHHGGVAGGG